MVFWRFQGLEKGCIGKKWVNYFPILTRKIKRKITENQILTRLIYNDKRFSYEKLSQKDEPVSIRHVRTVNQGSGSISYLGPKMWDNIPRKLKEASSIDSSKKSFRKKIQKLPLQTV